jgi:hypothetical protein
MLYVQPQFKGIHAVIRKYYKTITLKAIQFQTVCISPVLVYTLRVDVS